MPNQKTLNQWFIGRDISFVQRKNLIELGIRDDYLAKYYLKDLKKIDEWNKNKKPNIDGKIERLIFLSTWWNNNLVIIVNQLNNKYSVYLFIHEMASGNIPEILKTKLIETAPYWALIEERFEDLEKKLTGENPILYKSPTLSLYFDKKYKFKGVQRSEFDLPNLELEKDPDKYLKPFDVVKNCWQRNGKDEKHSAIYLGNKKVCHSGSTSGRENGGISGAFIEITDWKKYLQSNRGQVCQLIGFHPLIPYQPRDITIRNLAKSLENNKEFYRKREEGKFHLLNNNCEHFVNMAVYGVSISEGAEIEKVKREYEEAEEVKSYEDGDFKNEIEKNQRFFDNLTNSPPKDEIMQEIKKHANSFYRPRGTKLAADEARIEARPLATYRMTNN